MERRFTVRHLLVGDQVPTDLLGRWAQFPLDRDWVWVVEHHAAIEGLLIAAPMHGMVFLLRIAASDSAPDMWLLTMLRRVLRESRERGYLIAMTYLTTMAKELKLVRLATREGWIGVPETGIWVAGSTEVKH